MSAVHLYPHQRKALDQTQPFNRVAYYLDMGLGKTFVGSEKLLTFGTRKNLLVCQKSKIQDWIDHFHDYYPNVPVTDFTRKDSAIEDGITVINYELTFRRPQLMELRDFSILLDESSLIQNEKAKRSKFALKLAPDNVILLSGTPTGGKYEKLWSQLHLLGWNIRRDLFYKQYVETEWVEQDGFFRQNIIGYKNVDRLKAKLAQHGAVFMTTEDAGLDLPTKNFIPVKTNPPKEYGQFMRKRLITIDGKELVGDTSLTRRLYARQLCGLYNKARYEAFRDLVDSTDDRLIVFYSFTEEMNRMIDMVPDRPISILNGPTKDLTAYYNEPNAVTFIQYQAGAKGGNFQLASKIIYFSLPQGWEDYEQSQKRIHRIGQQRPCFYYLMMCHDSVEEDILETLKLRKDYNDELFAQYERGIL